MKDMFSFLKPKKDIQFVDIQKLSYHNFSVERAVEKFLHKKISAHY